MFIHVVLKRATDNKSNKHFAQQENKKHQS